MPDADADEADREAHRLGTLRIEAYARLLATELRAPTDDDGAYDPDVIAHYNLAVEAVLRDIRRIARG